MDNNAVNREVLDYAAAVDMLTATLGKEAVMVLATAADNRVTARAVSCILQGLTIEFQTDSLSLKYRQIASNANVALAVKNIQIEGIATCYGHPLAPENVSFARLFKKHYPQAFKLYSKLENEVVVRVEPCVIILWQYIDGKPYRDYLDITAKSAWRVSVTTEIYD
jgi:uncharacterized pyridoxamine 5'-phosphate oxidase family protein